MTKIKHAASRLLTQQDLWDTTRLDSTGVSALLPNAAIIKFLNIRTWLVLAEQTYLFK